MAKPDKEKSLYKIAIAKSNDMITAKYQSSLLEDKLMSLAMSRIDLDPSDPRSPLLARFHANEIRELFGTNNTHLYRNLKDLSKTIHGHTMIIEDGKGNFESFAMIPNAEYKDGEFTIWFNHALASHIRGLERNFTKLELTMLTSFKSHASFRIYELLRKDLFRSNPMVNDGLVVVEYGLAELHFMLGLASVENKEVARKLEDKAEEVNWDVLYDMLDDDEKQYDAWNDFSKRILKTAQKELAVRSDIKFEFEGIRQGRWIKRVRFYIYPNTPEASILEKSTKFAYMEQKIDGEHLEMQFGDLYAQWVGHNGLVADNIDLFLKAAHLDPDIVSGAIEKADAQPSIQNYVGWILSCIERDYKSIATIEGSKQRADEYREFRRKMAEHTSGNADGAKAMWERIKQKEEFPRFIRYMEDKGTGFETFDMFMSAEVKCDMYFDWWQKHKVRV